MRGEELPRRPAFSMDFQHNESGEQLTTGAIAVWEGNFKLIYNVSSGNSMLFNLKDDPDELHNIYDKEPGVGKSLLTLIQENLNKANEQISERE